MAKVKQEFLDNLFSVKGKSILVTGACGTLGQTVAAAYAKGGAKVLLSDMNEDKLKEVAEEIREEGGICDYYAADLVKEEGAADLIAYMVKTFGEINVLFLSHGYNKKQSIVEQSLADWEKVMDIDCKSVYIVCRAVANQMIEQGKGGKMVIVSSQRSMRGMKGYTGYCAAKAGVDLMIQSMACDLTADYGINVNTINPGVFKSQINKWMFEPGCEMGETMLKRMPVGRLGKAEDFVGMAYFLATSASDFLTGGNYDASGGYLSC